MHAMAQGTANTPPANSVGFQAPASVPSAFFFTLPGTPAAGFGKFTNGNPSVMSVGPIVGAELPAPGPSAFGGVQSKDCSTGGFNAVQKVNTDGSISCVNISGGGAAPSGTGFTHVTSGAWDTPADLTLANLPGDYYALSTGSANAYVVAPTQAVASYVTGEKYRMKASFATTSGAATVAFSGLAAIPIKMIPGGLGDPAANDIRTGNMVEFTYDGTNMQITSPSGNASLIASGTATLGTGAISANACASAVTVTATGAAATDVISWTPNADISGIAGFGVAAADGLIIYPYPTSGNVNFKVCNGKGTSITPGSAVVLNWKVNR